MRDFPTFILLLTLLGTSLIAALQMRPVQAATITVPDDFSTIRAAIEAAIEGSVVFVRSGTYSENLILDKDISLVGEDAQTTIVDGLDNPAISIGSDSPALIQGFTLKASLAIRQGLSVIESLLGNGFTVKGNLIRGIAGAYRYQPGWSINGIGLTTCTNVTIVDNWIGDFDYGLALVDSTDIRIRNNEINNTWVGIGMSGSATEGNLVEGNNITFTGAIHWGEWQPPQIPFSGIELTNNASENLFQRNKITTCYCGVVLESSMNNIFLNNTVASNGYSKYLLTNPDVPLVDTFGENDIWIGAHVKWNQRDWWSTLPSTGNVFYHNYLEGREKIHVTCNGNSWDDGYPSGGNYWKRFLAEDLKSGPDQSDLGADGIWDYVVSMPENNTDRYPLVNSNWSGFGVHNLDTGRSYLTVQQAIDAEQTLDEQSITIDPSFRFEHIRVNKALSIFGNGSGMTVIDGHSTGIVISLAAVHAQINSITVQRGQVGVLLEASSNCTVADLDIFENAEGIRLLDCTNNTLRNCFLADNACAVRVANSSGNVIFHNSFVRNTQHVQIESSEKLNIWDSGYPSGGNYWNDYDGADINHDGIGDSPYVIDSFNIDNFPLLVMPGTDVNQDGQVNVLDLILIANRLGWSGLPGSVSQDVNEDGKVNVLDLIAVARSLAAQ